MHQTARVTVTITDEAVPQFVQSRYVVVSSSLLNINNFQLSLRHT